MINDIIAGISQSIFLEFGDGYKIHKEEIKQGLEEPCFIILSLKPIQEQILGKRYLREQPFDIHYFPGEQDSNEEMLDVADRLNDAVEYIKLGDSLIRGIKMQNEIVDNVLHFFVTFKFYVVKTGDLIDNMENLSLIQEEY